MKKWSSLTLVLMLSAALSLSGCGGGDNNAGSEGKAETATNKAATHAPESSPAGEPAQDTLILGRGGDSASLDPAIVTDGES